MAEQYLESVFDVLDTAFERLILDGYFIDGRLIDPSLPQRPMRPHELKAVLLHPSGDLELRDTIWRFLIQEARISSDSMTVALWMLQPGMRCASGRFVRQLDVSNADIDSEFLTAVVAEIRAGDIDDGRLVSRLLAAGARQVRSIYATDRDTEIQDVPRPTETSHPEMALWRAVDSGVINAEEAELIATTRLGSDSLAALAVQCGFAYDSLQRRRYRAEVRLRAWLISQNGSSVEKL